MEEKKKVKSTTFIKSISLFFTDLFSYSKNKNIHKGNRIKIIVKKNKANILTGKKVLYLGSSVTYGSSSMQKSFVEYISERNQCEYIKEAVSGTTLVDNGPNSYVSRLKGINKDTKIDLFICQLSTNDASLNKELGSIVDANYNTNTICGAIQFIVSYVKDTFHCPVMFYTGSYFESERYSVMVSTLDEISKKMDFKVIDMYNNKAFNNISKKDYQFYMSDPIHPTRVGYYYWWTPYIETHIFEYLS